MQASNESKLKAISYAAKMKGSEMDLGIKCGAKDIIAEEDIVESVIFRLNSTLALVDKGVEQKMRNNHLLIKNKKN